MQYKWIMKHIQTNNDADWAATQYWADSPDYGAIDTETDGLHIIYCKPFIFQFGWIGKNQFGYAFAVDIEKQPGLARQVMDWWFSTAAPDLKVFVGHNMGFDLHMCKNIMYNYTLENVSDTMFYIRWGNDNIPTRHGGVPLKLKPFAQKYIDPEARFHELGLKKEQAGIAKSYNLKLKKSTGWTLGKIDEFFDDKMNDIEDLPPDIRAKYDAWLHEEVPPELQARIRGKVLSEDIPYTMLNRTMVIDYSLKDIVYTLETLMMMIPIVEIRQNQLAIKIEDDLIMPLQDMERVGFDADPVYLAESKKLLKDYILMLRQELYELAEIKLKVNQHKVIKNILNNKFMMHVTTTNDTELTALLTTLKAINPNTKIVRFIEVLKELRSLEKWYSVYLTRYVKELQLGTKLYTTINQVGAASGRVSSSFQQFPREGIKNSKGELLFEPRRFIIAPEGEFDAIVYLDYSQIELRIQALYTILVGDPDTNLIRAYKPYQCDTNTWVPTDIHGATACNAFDITADHPDFKKKRYEGKTLNFAKNYGATRRVVEEMFPDASYDEITRIDEAYYKTFPGVRSYHRYCYEMAIRQSNVINIFGVRYYNVSGHNLINMLIQGGAATLLKIKMRQLWEYSRDNNIRSQMQMQIHDELSWVRHRAEPKETFVAFKHIMEDWDDCEIPIIADAEITYTTWADKEEITL